MTRAVASVVRVLVCASIALACEDQPAPAPDPTGAEAVRADELTATPADPAPRADPASTAAVHADDPAAPAADPVATDVIGRGAGPERRGFRASGDAPLEPIDPRSHVAYGEITVTGPLEPLVARRVLRRYRTDLRACHTAALAADDDARGEITLELTLDTAGAVTSVRATDVTVPAAVATCIEARARAWQLAARPDTSVVRAAFTFSVEAR